MVRQKLASRKRRILRAFCLGAKTSVEQNLLTELCTQQKSNLYFGQSVHYQGTFNTDEEEDARRFRLSLVRRLNIEPQHPSELLEAGNPP